MASSSAPTAPGLQTRDEIVRSSRGGRRRKRSAFVSRSRHILTVLWPRSGADVAPIEEKRESPDLSKRRRAATATSALSLAQCVLARSSQGAQNMLNACAHPPNTCSRWPLRAIVAAHRSHAPCNVSLPQHAHVAWPCHPSWLLAPKDNLCCAPRQQPSVFIDASQP